MSILPIELPLQEMQGTHSKTEMAGYDRVASLMTGDKGLSIFRSFRKLNAKNLLYLQAEITLKENELNKIMQEDQESHDSYREMFSGSVLFLKGINEPSEQWEKWLEVRELLEKYSEFYCSAFFLAGLESSAYGLTLQDLC